MPETKRKKKEEEKRRLRDTGLIPVLGRSPGEAQGNPLQYSCPENPTDREPWKAMVQGVPKSWTRLKQLSMQCENSKTFMPYLRLCFIQRGVGRVLLPLSSRSWPGSRTAQVLGSAVGHLVPAPRMPQAVRGRTQRGLPPLLHWACAALRRQLTLSSTCPALKVMLGRVMAVVHPLVFCGHRGIPCHLVLWILPMGFGFNILWIHLCLCGDSGRQKLYFHEHCHLSRIYFVLKRIF